MENISQTRVAYYNKDIWNDCFNDTSLHKRAWYLLLFKTPLVGRQLDCYLRDFYHKNTVSLWDNKSEWQRIIRGYSFPEGRFDSSNLSGRPRDFPEKDPRVQLDFCLGTRNNTTGYSTGTSDLNRFSEALVWMRTGHEANPANHGG